MKQQTYHTISRFKFLHRDEITAEEDHGNSGSDEPQGRRDVAMGTHVGRGDGGVDTDVTLRHSDGKHLVEMYRLIETL